MSPKALRYVLGCLRLLVTYDIDAEGEKGAGRLERLSPRMRRIRPPAGKDVTAFWQAGGRGREWVRFELTRLQRWAGRPDGMKLPAKPGVRQGRRQLTAVDGTGSLSTWGAKMRGEPSPLADVVLRVLPHLVQFLHRDVQGYLLTLPLG